MELFFACITLAGSCLVLLALILMLAEKRRFHDYRRDIAEKRDELIEIIEDAEILLLEMNRFSAYSVSRLEEKYEMLNRIIEEADRRIASMGGRIGPETVSLSQFSGNEPAYEPEITSVKDEENTEPETDAKKDTDAEIQESEESKVVYYDEKRREIIKLSKNGMDSAQIARLLNMGRGEIELITKIGH